MKLKTIIIILMTIAYGVVFYTALGATVKAYGKDSIAFHIVAVGIGVVGFIVLCTHKGIDNWLKSFDKDD